MKFAPEYVSCVLNETFEDAIAQFLSPVLAIHYAHLVMLADQRIVVAMWMREGEPEEVSLPLGVPMAVVLVVTAAVTLYLGQAPGRILAVARGLGDSLF